MQTMTGVAAFPRAVRVAAGLAASVAVVIGAAACGSSSTKPASTSAGSSSAAASGGGTSSGGARPSSPSAIMAQYSGPEKAYLHTYAAPRRKQGYSFTIGFLQPNGQQQSLTYEENAARKETEALGGKFIGLDASSDITTQVNQFNQLLAQHVSAIIVYPNDPKSMTPDLAKAKSEHIPVVAISTPGIVTEPTLPGYAATIDQAFDQVAYGAAEAVAAKDPGAQFATEAFGVPVPALQFLISRYQYWGKKLGLHFAGSVGVQQDTASAYSAAASAILGKWPNVKAVFTFDTAGAQSVATLGRTQGKNILTCGYGEDTAAKQLISAGRMFCAGNAGFVTAGSQSVIAAYDLLTKQNLPLKKLTVVPGTVVTSANVGSVPPE